jgi:uncharacterized OsmC-like protein
MSIGAIQQAVAGVREFLLAHPEEGRGADSQATAPYQGGLQMRVSGPNNATIVTDMPAAVGGGGSAPTPGWFMRASLASCDATLIVMRAAEAGIRLTSLEVTIDSASDDRGMFGIGDDIPPGALTMRTCIRIGAENASHEQLNRVVADALARSPVADAIRRAVPMSHEIVVD